MGIISTIRDRYILAPLVKRLTDDMVAKAASAEVSGSVGNLQAFAVPLGYNTTVSKTEKLGSSITYKQLRNMAQLDAIARGCINIRKRQITQLDWDIVPVDKSERGDKVKKETALIKAHFRSIGGHNNNMRRLLDKMVEDYLVIDGVSLYKRYTRDGTFLGLIPLDSTTIKILLDDNGFVPQAPEVAYQQWIRGKKEADFTSRQLVYDMLNPKTDTPYGFSVLEALVMIVDQGLKASMFNSSYFSDGNVPAGFFGVPESWNAQQIKEYQEMFDAMLSGDPRFQRKVKFMPSGSGATGYTPAQQFDFGSMGPFMEYLMKVEGALFGVTPQELGFTDSVNKANGSEQTEIAKRNSIKPMTNAIEEIFTAIIQTETFGITDDTGKVVEKIGPFPEYEFSFMGMDVKDKTADATISDIMVKSGAKSVDEWRQEQGMEPIGLGNYIMTSAGPVLVSDFLAAPKPGEVDPNAPTDAPAEQGNTTTEEQGNEQKDATTTDPTAEIKRFEKKALADLKEGRAFRPFVSEVIDAHHIAHIHEKLGKCSTKEEVKALFSTELEEIKKKNPTPTHSWTSSGSPSKYWPFSES